MFATPSRSNDIRMAVLSLVAALCVIGACSIARADNYAYVTFDGGGLSSVDLDTGAFTQLGTSGQTLAGLGMANSILYGTTLNPGGLYRVSTSDGGLTSIGGFFDATGGFGSAASGLYAVDGSTGNETSGHLLSIDPATGTSNDLGNTGVSGSIWFNLSTNSSVLYYAVDGNLYMLNTTSGTATSIGSITYNGNPIQIGPMVEEGGILYGTDANNSIYTLNTDTGAATYVAAISDTASVYGLAPESNPSAVPVPPTLLLLGPGLVSFAVVRKKFKE